jgi:topoisomerase-4 subunit A
VIKEGMPWETDVHEILHYNAEKVMEFLKKELEIERDRLLEKIFYKTLERIFIENRLYKKIETIKTLEAIYETLLTSFKPYKKKLIQEPTHEILEKLLQIPIRRISQFDIDKNREEVILLEEKYTEVQKNLKNIKKYAIDHLKQLSLKFGSQYPRKTRVKAIEEIDLKAIQTKDIRVGSDLVSGFIGTKVSGSEELTCTNFDKLVVFDKTGLYKVVHIPEKQYFENIAWVGIADKKTIMSVVYKVKSTGQVWAKRFIVDKFILDKLYRYLDFFRT